METPSCFASTTHPGAASVYGIYARGFVRPFALCILPVMIGALLAVLQGYPALIFLTLGLPGAAGLAALWTLFGMQTRPAELCVRPGAASVRTVWACLLNLPRRWHPIFDLRTTPATLTLGLGDAAYELDRAAWPESEAMLDALRAARDAGLMPHAS